MVEAETACFLQGTRIATARGPVAVEALRVGDSVAVASRGRTPVCWRPVRWLGHRAVDTRRHLKPRDVWPVRIAPHAFGPGMPARALFLSPDHAVFIDGVLIPVRHLLNDATILQERRDAFTYWHVELDAHAVLFAESLPCESYLDTGNRSAFANGGPVVHLHPDFALGVWQTQACAPLVRDGAELVAARSHLLARAEELGHAATRDPALRVFADGQTSCPAAAGGGLGFVVPPRSRALRLTSRSFIPAHNLDDSDDHRRLGVAIAAIRLDGRPIALRDDVLGAGWHAAEQGVAWRWTNGDAHLTIPRGGVLEIEAAMTGRYWLERFGAAHPSRPHAA